MKVRPAQPGDYDAIQVILDHPLSRQFSPIDQGHPMQPDGSCHVLESEGALIAFCRLDPRNVGIYGLALLVHPEHQNKGVGGELLAHALKSLTKGSRVLVEVLSNNGAALAFFVKHGFQHVGRTEANDVLEYTIA